MSLPSPVRAGARASKEQLCLRMIPPSSLLLADTMGHVRPADAIAGGSPTAPAPATLPLDAWSGSAGVDAIVTAFVLAASRPSVSAPSSGRTDPSATRSVRACGDEQERDQLRPKTCSANRAVLLLRRGGAVRSPARRRAASRPLRQAGRVCRGLRGHEAARLLAQLGRHSGFLGAACGKRAFERQSRCEHELVVAGVPDELDRRWHPAFGQTARHGQRGRGRARSTGT
jgi:hypothetical protein